MEKKAAIICVLTIFSLDPSLVFYLVKKVDSRPCQRSP